MHQVATYIHQLNRWPYFTWNHEKLVSPLARVRRHHGRLLGRMEGLGFHLRLAARIETLTPEVLKSNEIEGEVLNTDHVRSIARRLGIDDKAKSIPWDRNVDGVVEMMLDATPNYNADLSAERLFDWHAALLPTARMGCKKLRLVNGGTT